MTDEQLEGWRRAALAWEVCASLHLSFCKKTDPFFQTRQTGLAKRAKDARQKVSDLIGEKDKSLMIK